MIQEVKMPEMPKKRSDRVRMKVSSKCADSKCGRRLWINESGKRYCKNGHDGASRGSWVTEKGSISTQSRQGKK